MNTYLESLRLQLDLAMIIEDEKEIATLKTKIRNYKINQLFKQTDPDELEFFE